MPVMTNMTINNGTVQNSKDSQSAYVKLDKNEDGEWIGVGDKNQNALEAYQSTNTNIEILAHTTDEESGFQATVVKVKNSDGSYSKKNTTTMF